MKDISWLTLHLQKLFLEKLDAREKLDLIYSKLEYFGGKLYKYFSFKDDHSLENLEKKNIHFTKPEEFNDPFDCALGFSVDKTIKAFIPSIIDTQIGLKADGDEQIKQFLLQLLLNQNPTINGKDKTAELLCFLFKQEDFKSLICKCINGEIASENEFQKCCQNAFVNFLSNPKTANEFFKIIAQPGQEHLFENIGNDDNTKKIFQSFPAILQEQSIGEKIKLIDKPLGEKFQNELEKVKNNISPQMEEIKKVINDKFAITCFSEKSDSVLMWSHYANKHTGFCVEYDLNKCSSLSALKMLYPVIYSSERGTVPMSLFDFSDPMHPVSKNSDASTPDVVISLLTKSSEWEYENEWRIIECQSNLNDGHLLESDMVSKIYLGANCTDENEVKLRKCINGSIPVERYQLDIEEYKLHLS